MPTDRNAGVVGSARTLIGAVAVAMAVGLAAEVGLALTYGADPAEDKAASHRNV